MTDLAPSIAPEDDETKGIQVDAHGDPLPQGTRMIEYESYERVIEGLKIAADACMHLACRVAPEEAANRVALALKLDQCRRICIQHAGIDDAIRAKQTEKPRGEPMRWREARDRLLEGLTQASGGARQLATCFRIDLLWSRVAADLEKLALSVRNPKRMRVHNPLLMPTGYTKH